MVAGFELATHGSRIANRLFVDHFKHFFMKFANQNLPFVGVFDFRETMKFPFTLSSFPVRLYLAPKSVKLYTVFLHLDSILAKNF